MSLVRGVPGEVRLVALAWLSEPETAPLHEKFEATVIVDLVWI
jgi:hypothetical protein